MTVVGSLCTGYGGLDGALALAGVRGDLAFVADYDPDVESTQPAARMLAHRHPGVPNLGDITTVDWATVPPVDILTAGFPCQPFSNAGLRHGTQDDRHLWPDGVQPAIVALRPPTVVLENVPGILTIQKGAVWRQVLADLDQLGYTTRWTTVGACQLGACHHRHRVFAVATLAARPAPDGGLFGLPLTAVRKWPRAGHVADGMLWPETAPPCGATGPTLPTPAVRDSTRGAGWADTRPGRPLSEVVAALPLLPTPSTVDAHAGVGAGVRRDGGPGVPNLRTAVSLLPTPTARLADRRGQPNRDTAARRMGAEGRRNLEDAIALLPTPRASDGVKGGPNQRGSAGDLALPAAVQPERWGQYAAAVHQHEQVFGTPPPDPTEPGRLGRPRLAATFVEWMMALPAGWVTGVPDLTRSEQIHTLGNGAIPAQAATALRLLLDPATEARATQEVAA